MVSDVPDHVYNYQRALEERGFAVEVTASAADALASAIAASPRCIIIDERVAGMRGWDLCRRLKSDLRVRNIPVVMLAHDLSEGATIDSRRTGCHSWLARPTAAADIARLVEDVIDQQTSGPRTGEPSTFGLQSCPACNSPRIRAGLRIGTIQYYSCQECGLFWCPDGEAGGA